MREIKFRALKDDVSNCNFVFGQLVYDAIGNTRITEVNSSGDGLLFHTCIKGTESQYTGLKDKNGKEIYEGDIVSAIDFEKTNYKIKFEDGCFIFTNGLRGHQLDYSTIQNLQAEVIGNIYENPELLNG